jgi:hypothetical protein
VASDVVHGVDGKVVAVPFEMLPFVVNRTIAGVGLVFAQCSVLKGVQRLLPYLSELAI